MNSHAPAQTAAHAAKPDSGHEHKHHVAPWQFLLLVLLVLLFMTWLTVHTAHIDLGATANTIIALVIALFKAALVVGFFMHLHWDNKFNAVVLLFTLLTIGCFLTFTIIDLSSRTLVDPTRAITIPPDVAQQAVQKAIAEGRLEPPTHGEAGHAAPAPAPGAAPGAGPASGPEGHAPGEPAPKPAGEH